MGIVSFSSYVVLDPASSVYQTNICNIRHTSKYIEILAPPKHNGTLYIDLKKDHTMHRNDP